MRLQNKSAIVTGAAQGLGEALARRLAVEGCDVLLADINLDKARAAADAIERDTGRRTGATQTNVASETDVQAMVDEALERLRQAGHSGRQCGHRPRGRRHRDAA